MREADYYFQQKLASRMSVETRAIVVEAQRLQREYPRLSGPELVRLAYWGSSGVSDE